MHEKLIVAEQELQRVANLSEGCPNETKADVMIKSTWRALHIILEYLKERDAKK